MASTLGWILLFNKEQTDPLYLEALLHLYPLSTTQQKVWKKCADCTVRRPGFELQFHTYPGEP